MQLDVMLEKQSRVLQLSLQAAGKGKVSGPGLGPSKFKEQPRNILLEEGHFFTSSHVQILSKSATL